MQQKNRSSLQQQFACQCHFIGEIEIIGVESYQWTLLGYSCFFLIFMIWIFLSFDLLVWDYVFIAFSWLCIMLWGWHFLLVLYVELDLLKDTPKIWIYFEIFFSFSYMIKSFAGFSSLGYPISVVSQCLQNSYPELSKF